MAELMLVNPRKRRKARRSPAQRAATRKLVARNRKRRRNPAPRTVSRRRASPVRRRRTPARSVATTARKRRYQRNPNGRGMIPMIMNTVMPAATAATGAIALDILWGFIPLPIAMKTGPMRHIVKGVGALSMGWLAAMVVRPKTAETFTAGAMTVVMYNAIRELTAQFMPNVPLGYYSAGMSAGDMGAYVPTMGEYTNGGMGAYIGGAGTSPYLSQGGLSTQFAGPSAATMSYARGVATGSALENEQNMGSYY